jgi:hypothetical protein
MLCRVVLVRNDVSEELNAFFIRVTRIVELGTTLAVTSNRRTLRRNTKCFSTYFEFCTMNQVHKKRFRVLYIFARTL